MRIVAGKYGSRRIETRKSNDTRPTLDKVREAVFSSLGGMFAGGIFIDLYAGSGANGFEAISRGMDEAWFSDISHEAIRYIKKNAAVLGCLEQCHIFPVKDMQALKAFQETGKKADVIYLDPPYAKQHNKDILMYIDHNDLLKNSGTVVIESDKNDSFHDEYDHLEYQKEKVYGIVRITYYQHKENEV